jgi:hypothetical protein
MVRFGTCLVYARKLICSRLAVFKANHHFEHDKISQIIPKAIQMAFLRQVWLAYGMPNLSWVSISPGTFLYQGSQ